MLHRQLSLLTGLHVHTGMLLGIPGLACLVARFHGQVGPEPQLWVPQLEQVSGCSLQSGRAAHFAL